MKKIAFLGGSFDPPHMGHVINIMEVLNTNIVDEVWVMPAGTHIEKNLVATKEQRAVMVEMMISTVFGSHYPVFMKSEDLESDEPLSSYRLFLKLREKYPSYEFYMIVGDDIISCIKKWEEGKELLKIGKFIVVPQLGSKKVKLNGDFTYIDNGDFIQSNISSTSIRERIKNNQMIEAIVPSTLIAYIIRQGLYRREK